MLRDQGQFRLDRWNVLWCRWFVAFCSGSRTSWPEICQCQDKTVSFSVWNWEAWRVSVSSQRLLSQCLAANFTPIRLSSVSGHGKSLSMSWLPLRLLDRHLIIWRAIRYTKTSRPCGTRWGMWWDESRDAANSMLRNARPPAVVALDRGRPRLKSKSAAGKNATRLQPHHLKTISQHWEISKIVRRCFWSLQTDVQRRDENCIKL